MIVDSNDGLPGRLNVCFVVEQWWLIGVSIAAVRQSGTAPRLVGIAEVVNPLYPDRVHHSQTIDRLRSMSHVHLPIPIPKVGLLHHIW